MPDITRRNPRPRRSIALAAACLLLAGCASAPPDYVTQTKDPWEGMNRAIYGFNDKLDKAVVRPVATTYVRAVPEPARNRFHAFLSNLDEPVTVANDLLQGKAKQTLQDTGRFLINSTLGLLGFFDVAKHLGLPHHDEDFGETLAHWGVPSGPYLVLPVLGPSTVRDAGGRYVDIYADPPKENMPPRYRNAVTVMDGLDTRVGLMQVNASIDSAYDPYVFVRDAYLQNRRYNIYDGNPPLQSQDYPDVPDDDEGAPAAASASGPATAAPAAASAAKPASPAPAAGTVPPPADGLKDPSKY
ncbi:MAG TPA: VacJ family lipoprotein [Gammaproteobacteria bacterium]|nr:VacJ family lipoprotein [Gammaproteobacteria bacterium]